MKIYKWAIIGPGAIAHEFAKDLKTLNNAQLYAVFSSSMERAEKFAEEYNIPKVYDEIEAICENDKIDIVYIATINSRHKKEALSCLNAGINVLCVKPIAMNKNDLLEMVSCAKSNNVFLMEAVWTNFLPAIRKVKAWIAEGKIGKIRMITADFGFRTENKIDRLYDKSLGGGALLDLGAYSLGIPYSIVGCKPTAIASTMYIGTTAIDETTNFIVNFKDGVCIRGLCAFNTHVPMDMCISGTIGRIYVPYFCGAKRAELFIDNEMVESYTDASDVLGFAYEAQAVMKCLDAGKKESDIMPHALSLDIVEIMDEFRKSAGLKYDNEE